MRNKAETSCIVPVSVLTAAPFSLAWGSTVKAKVKYHYTNNKEIESSPGGDAYLITSPDPPINLKEIISRKTSTSISLDWDPPKSLGGARSVKYAIEMKPEGQ